MSAITIRCEIDGYVFGSVEYPIEGLLDCHYGVETWDIGPTMETLTSQDPLVWCILKGYARRLPGGCCDYPDDGSRGFVVQGLCFKIDSSIQQSEEYPDGTPVWVAYLDHLAGRGWQDDIADIEGFITDRFDLAHERFDVLRAMFPDLSTVQTVDLWTEHVPGNLRSISDDLRWRTSRLRLVGSEDSRMLGLHVRDEG